MKKILTILVLVVVVLLITNYLDKSAPKSEVLPNKSEEASEPQVQEELGFEIIPEKVLQGDPAIVRITGVSSVDEVKSITFNGKSVDVFEYQGNPHILVGIDLRMPAGSYPLLLELDDGRKLKKDFIVSERVIAKAPLGIPDKLGGNTSESEQELLRTLVEEGRIISAVPTSDEKLWDGEFRLPLNAPIVITDTYGYSRVTGGSSISHKGTDYRAAIGTPVYAMNSGKVVLTRQMRNYGKTIVIDHGQGLHTIYMHLSEIGVELNQEVKKGDLIGKSGDTGYVLGPHLHLTIRIDGVSIDPEKFIKLLEN